MTYVFIEPSYSKVMQVVSIVTMFWSEALHFEFVICQVSRTLNSSPWTICSSSVIVRHSLFFSFSLLFVSVWHLASGMMFYAEATNKVSSIHTLIFPSLLTKECKRGRFKTRHFSYANGQNMFSSE
ncbi:hypothetical protein LI328DRAFT_2591 [Trichoderma asperelloides]|nr:hypothetical protein LI328DRAFT_2591 [Trichoderma asperelloides]